MKRSRAEGVAVSVEASSPTTISETVQFEEEASPPTKRSRAEGVAVSVEASSPTMISETVQFEEEASPPTKMSKTVQFEEASPPSKMSKTVQFEEEASPPTKMSKTVQFEEEASPPTKISKTAQVEEVFPSTGSLSQDEERKLKPEYWMYPDSEHGNEIVRICLPEIEKAYLAIKKSVGDTFLTGFLDCVYDMNTTFHFTNCVKRMKDFTKEIQAARMILSDVIGDDVPHQAAIDFPHQVVYSTSEGKSHQNSHRLFLVAKHILEQCDIHPVGDHHLSTPQFVEAGVKQLKDELRSAESELMDVMKRARGCYHVVEKIYNLARRFKLNLGLSSAYVRGRDVFEEVGRLLYLQYNINGEKDDFSKNFFAVLDEMNRKKDA